MHLGVALVAAGILFSTWARSSTVAFLMGVVFLNLYYGLTRSFLAKAGALLVVCLLLASPLIQYEILEYMAKDREGEKKEKPSQIVSIIRGEIFQKGPSFESVVESRSGLWSEAWEGFKEKPLLGWGFGANKDTDQEWAILPTSGGLVRDATNDLLLTLEGSGLIGCFAYLAMMIAIFKQSLSRKQVARIRSYPNEKMTIGERARGLINQKEKGSGGGRKRLEFIQEVKRDHQHAIFYILSISLFVLFQTDGSAFSAGSLISAIFWLCAGAAGGLRAEAIAAERVGNRVKERGQSPLKERHARRDLRTGPEGLEERFT